jgi:hypothetical protein
VRVLDAHPGVGLTFSRRRVALEDETSEGARAWKQMYSEVHRPFGELDEVNSGRAMLSRYVAAGLPGNWIGEQTCVMLRRGCLLRSGLFNRRLRQLGDMDLWIRLMALFEVGFLDDELATRWVGSANETGANLATRREWLDRLWMLEGLKELPELWYAQPRLADMRRAERKSVIVALLTGRHRTTRVGEALADVEVYLRHAASAAIGRRESLFDRI